MGTDLPKLAVTGSRTACLAEVTHDVLTLTGRPPARLADHLEQQQQR